MVQLASKHIKQISLHIQTQMYLHVLQHVKWVITDWSAGSEPLIKNNIVFLLNAGETNFELYDNNTLEHN
jgi:hypothetical protein